MLSDLELELLLADLNPINIVTHEGMRFDVAVAHPTLAHMEIWVSGEREGSRDEWFLSDRGYLQNTYSTDDIDSLVCAGAPFYSQVGAKSGVYTNTANLVPMVRSLAFHIASADVSVAAIGCARVARTDRSVKEDAQHHALSATARDAMISAHALAGQFVREGHRIQTIADGPRITVPLAVVDGAAIGAATGLVAFDSANPYNRVRNLTYVWSVLSEHTKYRFIVTKAATGEQFSDLRNLWERDNVYVVRAEEGLEDLKEATHELVEGYFQSQ